MLWVALSPGFGEILVTILVVGVVTASVDTIAKYQFVKHVFINLIQRAVIRNNFEFKVKTPYF